jgi:hypothetical protein
MSERYKLIQGVWHVPTADEQRGAAERCAQQAIDDTARWERKRAVAGSLRALLLAEARDRHNAE